MQGPGLCWESQAVRTIAVIALKGGSGKTTVAMQMALAAHWRGVDAMVVDIDPQHSAHDILGAREEPGPACVISTGPKLLSAKFAAVGLKKDVLIVDTPAGAVEEVTEAIVLADYVVLVVRPTLLDIAGLVRSFRIVQRLARPCVVVVNQAPVPRESVEAPLVRRAL
jgi:chromosome partitioning protein